MPDPSEPSNTEIATAALRRLATSTSADNGDSIKSSMGAAFAEALTKKPTPHEGA